MSKSYPKLISFTSRATAYYPPPPEGYANPEEARMEGGRLDRMGNPLYTLQDHLEGRAPYVSVAMDSKIFPYGTLLCLPAMELHYNRPMEFRVVDTGGAFENKGRDRMDICVRNGQWSLDPMVNRMHVVVALALDAECRAHLGGKGKK